MAIEIFSNTSCDWSVKALVQNNEQWFCGKDVAKALGYSNTNQALRDHVFEEDRLTLEDLMGHEIGPMIKYQEKASVYISEPGVYALIFGSKMEQARQFKKWVCQDVLPRLRKSFKPQLNEPLCLKNETALHEKVVDFIRKHYPQALLIAGLGELQTSADKRIQAWRKGYTAGQPDLIIANAHKTYNGLCLEFKTPKGNGRVSEKQVECLENFKKANFKTQVVAEYDTCVRCVVEYIQDVRLCCPHCNKKFKTQESLSEHLRVFHRIS